MTLSFRACLMNILPFLVYGLALFGIMIGVGVLFGIVGAVFGSLAGPLAAVVFMLLIPVMVAIGTVVVISIYTGYRDVFYHALGTGARGSWAAH
jgi:hypothetical protein